MTVENTAMSPFLDPGLPSLEDALARLETLPGTGARRLARVRSAMRTFSRLLDKATSELPAHQGFITQQVRRLRQRPTSLSPKSLANMKTELLFLVRTAYGRGRRSAMVPLSGSWRELRETLGDRPVWWKLSRMAAFCSGQQITPTQVDDTVITLFRTALVQSEELDRPETHLRAAAQAWNRVAQRMHNQGLMPVTLPAQRYRRWTLKPAAFVPSFTADVERWLSRLGTFDPLAEAGPRRALRPETLRLRRHQIFKAASALVFAGQPIEAVHSLADLVTDEAFVAIMGVLLKRQDDKTTEALHGLGGALLAIARHHVKLPKGQTDRLARRVARLAPEEILGFRDKTRTRLAPLEDDRLLSALLHLPERLLCEAKAASNPRQAALRAQMAVGIEIELNMPLRLSNLVRFNLLQHVRRIVIDRRERWVVEIPWEETKNRQPLCFELQPASVDLIERALKFYEAKAGALFPGRFNLHKTPTTLGTQLRQTIERRLGIPFHLHLFRALAGLLYLRANPAGFETVRALLGDRDDQVVRTHYSFVADRHLIAEAQASIAGHRARLKAAPTGAAAKRSKRA